MSEFAVSKEELARIVSACQERTYADEIDILLEKGEDVKWLLSAVSTDEKKGIQASAEAIAKRKEHFGSN